MGFRSKPMILESDYGQVEVPRQLNGEIFLKADGPASLGYGLGWIHGSLRGRYLAHSRALLQGRLSDLVKPTPPVLEIDGFIRSLDLMPHAEAEISSLESSHRAQLQAYCQGLNVAWSVGPWKRLDRWQMEDSLLLARTLGAISTLEVRMELHRFVTRMVQNDVPWEKISELFSGSGDTPDLEPYRTGAPLVELSPDAANWLSVLPRWRNSMALALGGKWSVSGGALLGFSWEMDLSRPENPFLEVAWEMAQSRTWGFGLPGFPGLLAGNNGRVAWSCAPSTADSWGVVFERLQKNHVQRPEGWESVKSREERFTLDHRHVSVENWTQTSWGRIHGHPGREGVFPTLAWAGRSEAGTLNLIQSMATASSAPASAERIRGAGTAVLDWCLADTHGGLARTQSGQVFDRTTGGLNPFPVCGWEPDPLRLQHRDHRILETAPETGRLFAPGAGRAGEGYKSERIKQIILPSTRFEPEDLKKILWDRYAVQAQKVLAELRFTLPEGPWGDALRTWDCSYRFQEESRLFDALYLDVIKGVFGRSLPTLDLWKELHPQSPLYHELLPRFEACLFRPTSVWMEGLSKERALALAVKESVAKPAVAPPEPDFPLLPPVWREKRPGRPKSKGPALPGGRFCLQSSHQEILGGRVTSFGPRLKVIQDLGLNRAWICGCPPVPETAHENQHRRALTTLFRDEYEIRNL